MFGNLLIEEPSLTGRLEHDRDQAAKAVHFQVNYKFRRYWSHNTVIDDDIIIFEVRECPECRVQIEHDERGYPYCLKCGSIFPLPRLFRKMDKQQAYELRKFLQGIQHHEDRGASVGGRGIPRSVQPENKGASASNVRARPRPCTHKHVRD
jgi:ribosomal protein S27AE